MSNINLIKEIKKHNIITEKERINANIKKDRWWEIRKLKKLKLKIEKQNPKISDLLEKLYFIYFELVKIPSCETCGKKVAFNSFQKGYKRHCSSSCATLNKDVQKTRKIYRKIWSG